MTCEVLSHPRYFHQFAHLLSPFFRSCNCGNAQSGCDEGIRASGGGQPCLWFSQGCTIGCATCTGIGSHSNVSLCESPTTKHTLPKRAWTMNRNFTEDGAMDSYKWNPWRAPGSAPVSDPCGMAGGTQKSHEGPGDAVFSDYSLGETIITMGDLGSKALPTASSGTVWVAGTSVEVAWGIRYNHGGGYAYRLCKVGDPLGLTEECFQKGHLNFDYTKQVLQWKNGTRLSIPGTWVSTGTTPRGSQWSMNPIPRIDFDSHSSGQAPGYTGCRMAKAKNGTGLGPLGPGCRQFDPPCPQDEGWFAQRGLPLDSVDVEGQCSGDWTLGMIVDRVQLPLTLTPGEYVLGWRWDCEESTQVWSSCADVSIVSPS